MEGIEMNTYLHGPMDFAKTLKLRFHVHDLELPDKERGIYTSIREEEDIPTCRCIDVPVWYI